MLALNANNELLLTESLGHHVVSNSNHSLLDEVHICNFIFFIKDQLVVLSVLEFCWLQSKANVVNKLGTDVLISVEENSVAEDDVVEQVMQHNVSFYYSRTLVEELVVLCDRGQPIIRPVIGEVLVDTVDQHLGQRLVRKPGKKGHPAVKVATFVITSHPLVVRLDNLNERSHDL